MSFLSGLRQRRALRRYARELPQRLYRDYGASEHFTPAQIRVAVSKRRLDDAYIAFGFAMFLPEDKYNDLLSDLRNPTPYEEARAAFLHSAPNRPSSAHDFHESGLAQWHGSGPD